MTENLHLIQFTSQASSVTPDFFFCIRTFLYLSAMNKLKSESYSMHSFSFIGFRNIIFEVEICLFRTFQETVGSHLKEKPR